MDPLWHSSRFQYTWDLTDVKYPVVILCIVTGIILIYKSYKIPNKKTTNGVSLYRICPKCEKAFDVSKLKSTTCPEDGAELVPLNGYFEKEKKDD